MASLLKTLVLLGSLQGFIVSCLLFFAKKNRQTSRILSALIFLMALASFNLYADYSNWFGLASLRFIAQFIPWVIVMPFGPLIWFYIRSSLDPSFIITKKWRRHFYPVIIDLVPSFTVILFFIGWCLGMFKNTSGRAWGNFIDTYNVYADIPRWVSVTWYLWISHTYILSNKKNHTASAGSIKWLQFFVRVFLVFQCIWLLYLVPYSIPRFTDYMLNTLDWYPVYIPLAIMIYWLGIKGYMISQAENTTIATKKTALLPAPLIKDTIELLQKAMEQDKLYLNPGLSLHLLSVHTGIAPKIISAVLNQHLSKSFNEFINSYRINEFKEKISQPQMDQFTIAGVAMECGFNSQATFQRSFKEVTGMSPTEFRNHVGNKGSLHIDSSQIRI